VSAEPSMNFEGRRGRRVGDDVGEFGEVIFDGCNTSYQ
jgi:hypothetical protein